MNAPGGGVCRRRRPDGGVGRRRRPPSRRHERESMRGGAEQERTMPVPQAKPRLGPVLFGLEQSWTRVCLDFAISWPKWSLPNPRLSISRCFIKQLSILIFYIKKKCSLIVW